MFPRNMHSLVLQLPLCTPQKKVRMEGMVMKCWFHQPSMDGKSQQSIMTGRDSRSQSQQLREPQPGEKESSFVYTVTLPLLQADSGQDAGVTRSAMNALAVSGSDIHSICLFSDVSSRGPLKTYPRCLQSQTELSWKLPGFRDHQGLADQSYYLSRNQTLPYWTA